jgi:hypothetical protein
MEVQQLASGRDGGSLGIDPEEHSGIRLKAIRIG